MTQDRKCGRYVIVWTDFFSHFTFNSLRTIARDREKNMLNTIFPTLMTTVLVRSCLQYGFSKNCLKYLYHGSAHGDFRIPFLIWKSLNAIRIPYMGKYENAAKNRMPGTASRRSCIW